MIQKTKLITCDKIFAHSAIVDSSLFCDAASNLPNNLFSSSACQDVKKAYDFTKIKDYQVEIKRQDEV